ncbi:MAG: tRNA (N(6)-L-threonylcarbamoyladenosine(37)-C(2))-methylthiotransferase MtaB, partial [Alphaproteobacteria bacterium]|nr:tRNA (N(6)-L-threonylcarbamoyladenosine(37)-C(2))-methylthiotransferase MtaB [Alphaproteobacteria bacterium]
MARGRARRHDRPGRRELRRDARPRDARGRRAIGVSTAPEVVTFGCRLNAFESALIAERAAAAGLRDAVIVNTCAVTAEAERQARQAIRRLRRGRPGAQLIVTGCAAELDPARYAAMPEVDRVVGNGAKLLTRSYGGAADPTPLVNDPIAMRETAAHLIAGFAGRSRAFLQVQNGCDHRCTFCTIPFARGPNRSVPVTEVIAAVRDLVAAGFAEVVLTGVDIGDYGRDLPSAPSLGTLAAAILTAVPELPRLRLSSLDPVEVDGTLLDCFAHERLMPHLHLSLQAGDDLILKRMKRRHRRADAIAVCAELRRRRPDIVFGADLIAGFPTETEAMFANTLALIAECDLTHVHVFPYSERPGTPAARMPALPLPVRRERARR